MPTVTGIFDVTMRPEADASAETGSARMRLEKRYHGALDASALGTFLGARTAVEGSAGYVAIERVSGTLDGRQGSFVLQHAGSMERGSLRLEIHVVPDSADGELQGLRGQLGIRIDAGKHYYSFDYTLP